MTTARLDEAFAFARHLHRDQRREGTSVPAIAHLMAVSALVMEHGGDEDQAVAALLHNAAEDQGGLVTLQAIRERFGGPVAAIVSDCTEAWTDPKPPWRARKEAFLASLADKPRRSLLVALADEVHNAEAIAADRSTLGDALWARFSVGREAIVWYYSGLAGVFAEHLPGPLADRLRRAVAEFGQ